MEATRLTAFDAAEFWESGQSVVFQNPRQPRPAPGAGELPPGTLLFATSGTSGSPRWIALTKQSFLAGARCAAEAFALNHTSVWLRVLPEFHVGGLAIHARAAISGGRVITAMGKWNAIEMAELAARRQVTHTSLVPTQVHDLVSEGLRPPESLRAAFVGGGPLSESLHQRALELGWPLTQTFGMTETGSMVAAASKRSPFGGPLDLLPGWSAAVDESGGRLRLKGPGLLDACYEFAAEHWRRFDPKSDDGYFLTFDLADVSGGRLLWLGRADRVVKIFGELVNLDAVEAALGSEAGISFCVLALPDPRRGFLLAVAAECDISPAVEAYNTRCAPFARIERILQRDKLPRSPLGKLLRHQITTDT